MRGMERKIPCSVSILTLNSARTLATALESVKDFAEIIVCDGNSTDATLDIARSYSARVIRQYDTDEPNVSCNRDFAAVRERAMAASAFDWTFFVDADDTLSPEAADEIRAIVENPHPAHFVWRMPTRIFLDGLPAVAGRGQGRKIEHEASYPSYQTRLAHKSVGAHFRNAIHERLSFDEKKFPVGTMRSFYYFHWPQERAANYWKYLGGYARREIEIAQFGSFTNFFYWNVYRRIRTLLGYILWRLPMMYFCYGCTDSMPLGIELTIVRYHNALLWGSIKKYIATRVWFILFSETLRGKDLNRTLSNLAAREWEAYGRVFDVGGGHGNASYWRFMQTRRWHRVTTADIDAHAKPDVLLNLETDTIPFAPGYFDTALLCNVLEHLDRREAVLKKIAEVLRPGGKFYGIVPFLVGVHPDPHDYVRLTDESLRALLLHAGFSAISITPIGRGPLVASYYQSEFLLLRFFKLLFLPIILCGDAVMLKLRPNFKNKFPLSYAFTATR
jgi:glycosyltransferase involved in cell wall biosynthesis